MSENLANYKIGHEQQLVMLGNERVIGVQSVSAQQNFGLAPMAYAGMGVDTVKYIPRQEQNNVASINSLIINKDYFFDLVAGDQLKNMYIMRSKSDTGTCYTMTSGYFTDFNCSYSIGNIPEVTVSANFVGNAGSIDFSALPSNISSEITSIASEDTSIPVDLKIPFGNSMTLNIGTFETNRLQSFQISVKNNKSPIYKMGSKFPKKIEAIGNVEVAATFAFEVGDYEAEVLRRMPQHNRVQNIELILKDYSTNEFIKGYFFNGMTLISETYSTSINGVVTVSLSFGGHSIERVTDGLVAWWRLNEGSGLLASDSSGNNNDGATLALNWEIGPHGDPVAKYAGYPVIFGQLTPLVQNFSACFWMKPSTITASSPISWGDFVTGWVFLLEDPYGFSAYLNSTQYFFNCPEVLSGQWLHIALIINNSNSVARLYINGSLVESALGSTTITAYSGGAKIFADGDEVYQFNGSLNDVRIYDRVLTDDEIGLIFRG